MSACTAALPSPDQMFFYLGARPPSDWGQPSSPTHTHSSRLLGGLPAVPLSDPCPRALVLAYRWSFLGLAILQGEILRDIISVVPWTQGGNRVCKETNASWNEQKCRTEERARVWEIGIKVAVVSNKKALITKRRSGLLTFKQCCCWS